MLHLLIECLRRGNVGDIHAPRVRQRFRQREGMSGLSRAGTADDQAPPDRSSLTRYVILYHCLPHR